MAQQGNRRVGFWEKNRLIDGYLLFDDERWRQGYCAGLTRSYGRRTMKEVRAYGENRRRGNVDWQSVGSVLAHIADSFRRAFRV